MKKWTDRVWAKAAAFVLTLVFAALTAVGAAGTVVLVSQNVFLDGGESLSAALYEEQCYSAILQADSFLRTELTAAGLLAGSYDAEIYQDGDTYNEYSYDGIDSILLLNAADQFLQEFSRESFPCRLTVFDTEGGYVIFDNFSLTDNDSVLYTADETFRYDLTSGATQYVTITAQLLQPMSPPSYGGLLAAWLLEHTGLTVFLTVLFGLLTLFCFCFSLASAGHWQGRDGIHLTWLDRIPLDVLLLLVVFPTLFLLGGYGMWTWQCGVSAVCSLPLALLAVLSFAARCKAGNPLKNTAVWRLLRLIWRIVRTVAAGLWRLLRGIPLVWKTALVMVGVFFLEMLLVLVGYGTVDGIFVVMKAVELLTALCIALNLRTLQKGGERLSQGDFSVPINTKYLFGDFRRFGQELNAVQDGLESAVQEQMRSERMKTELITNVSHDIKTPLTSIVNYVDLLKKEDIPSPAAREYIAVLDRQSKRLKKLTEDLVEASKASSGALPVELQPTDVNVLFSQITGEYQDRLADCRLTLVTQPPEGHPVISADSRLLSRVMDNLMSNICKYAMPETRVYVSGLAADGWMTLSFKNVSRAELNISPDELMERFVRGDASRHTEGSGLGLSIAQSLVQLMGGTFRLSIDADLFRADVTLPLVQQC